MPTHTDIADRPIDVGSFIVYAASPKGYSVAVLRYGRVVGLTYRAGGGRTEPSVRAVTADYDAARRRWSANAGGKPVTLTYTKAVLVVPESAVPPEVLALI